MTDYLFRLELPADKRSFTVAEALDATSNAIHQDSGTDQPVTILSIDKVEHRPLLRDLAGRPTALEEADWGVLRVIWSGMDTPEFPMTLAEWQPFLDAFNSSPNKPAGWSLTALQSDPEVQSALRRAVALLDHRDILKRTVNARAINLRNPLTGVVSELGWIGDADSWLLTVEQFKALCDMLAIEVVATDRRPEFQTPARPQGIPAALRLLPPLTEILASSDIGGCSGTGTARAGEYIAYLEGIMGRQAQGLFTVAEAAQVLTDARPGADVRGMLKKMRTANRDGKLPFRDPGDQLPKVIADFHRDHSDLVKDCDIDAWLTGDGAGYLFPPAAGTDSPGVPTAAPETPKQRRARLLAILDAEAAAGRERGALARITEIERRTRPTADRSNIGKDIKKAREERNEARRGGELSRLLG